MNEHQIMNMVHLYLGSDQYRTYNVEIARRIGMEEAVILNELIDQHKFYTREGKLVILPEHTGEWFYCDASRFEERTAIGEKALLRVVKSLKSQGLITYVNAGLPAKRHFQINYAAVFNISNINSIIPKWEPCDSQMGTTQFPNGNPPHIYNEPKNKPKKDSSPNSPPASSALSEDAFGLADFLHSKIHEQNPKAKPPDRHKWATTIDRMHRLDGYSWDEIRVLIEFAHNDSFWAANILSADKLRKQATQLTAKMKQADRKSPAEQSFERSETNRKLADNLYLQIKEPYRRLRVFDTGCQVKVGGKWVQLRYSENGFKEQLDSLIRKSENR